MWWALLKPPGRRVSPRQRGRAVRINAHLIALLSLVKLQRLQSISYSKEVFLPEPHTLITRFNTGFISASLCGMHARSLPPCTPRRWDVTLRAIRGRGIARRSRVQSSRLVFNQAPRLSLASLSELKGNLISSDLFSGSLDHQSGRWGLLIHRLNHFRSLSSASDCPPPRGKLRGGGWCEGPDYLLVHSRVMSKPASLKCISTLLSLSLSFFLPRL